MTQRIFVFKAEKVTSDGRPCLLAIPENQITELRSVVVAHNVQLAVNGVLVTASFNDLIDALGERVDMF
jgi:hypothetical protein